MTPFKASLEYDELLVAGVNSPGRHRMSGVRQLPML